MEQTQHEAELHRHGETGGAYREHCVPPSVGRYLRSFLPRQQLFDSLSRRFTVIDQAYGEYGHRLMRRAAGELD
jgi:hypothetical protein